MAMICCALVLLATISVVFSRHYPPVYECIREYKECISGGGGFPRIPTEYNCAWEDSTCTDGRIYMRAQCNCNCPGSMLCCDPSILEEYDYPVWHGTAPFCGASCGSCGGDESLCWWQSRCGNGAQCWTGNKHLCGVRRRINFWPFQDKTVSSLLQYVEYMLHAINFQSCYINYSACTIQNYSISAWL